MYVENEKVIMPITIDKSMIKDSEGREAVKEIIKPITICPFEIDESLIRMRQNERNEQEVSQSILNNTYKIESRQIVRAKEEKDEDELKSIANYEIRPYEIVKYINKEGVELKEKEEIYCWVVIDGETPKSLVIFTKNIGKIASIVGKKFSTAMLDYRNKNASKIVENNLRYMTRGIKQTYCLVDYGWQIVEGKRIYLHDGRVVSQNIKPQTNMDMPFLKYADRTKPWEIFGKAMCLYEDINTMSVLAVYSLLGVTYKLFEEAGHPPRFLLFMNGKTGSMKTTLAKILYTQLTDNLHRDTPRRIDADTIVSFERGIVEAGRDTVTLIDDYSPAKTQSQKNMMAEKLESIIRMVGDGSTKSRSNTSLNDCRGEGVKGVVVVTGELIGKGLSSRLRCFYCGISREKVNLQIVTEFQAEPMLFDTFIQHFIFYLEENWNMVVGKIAELFKKYRYSFDYRLKEKRLVDSVVTMTIVCDILNDFFVLYCGVNELELQNFISRLKEGIYELGKMSEIISSEETPATSFVKMLDTLLQSNELWLCDKPCTDEFTQADAFYDAEYIYFNAEIAYKKVLKKFKESNIYFPLDFKETLVALDEENIIKTCANGKNKRTYLARISAGNGKRFNYLKISIARFKEIVET